ncbi:MAG: hypothetical protein EBU90_26655 [Proteobacteria bacterium]|nr:hypothetical protein [Pseudomonadota bacterium]
MPKEDLELIAGVYNQLIEENVTAANPSAVKDWYRLEPGMHPIDSDRKAVHTGYTILQFIYSICQNHPDFVAKVMKSLRKAYEQDRKHRKV